MKRCVAVTLVLMGGAALTACGDAEVDTAVFDNVSQCVQSGTFSQDKCKSDYQAALASHEKTAPAYRSKEDCEAEFGTGKCEEKQGTTQAASGTQTTNNSGYSTGGIFLPMMIGYMMGSTFSGGRQMPPQALYKQNGSSRYVNANGATVANRTGPAKFSSSSAAVRAPATRTQTMARGGFGSRAHAISS